MQSYEIVYIIAGDTPEDEVKKNQKKILDLIETNQGKIIKEDFWGKKSLAYSIKKQDYGFYVIIDFDLEPEKLKNIESKIRLLNKIIRYLITKKEPVKAKESKKAKSKKLEVKKVTKIEKQEKEEPKIEKPKPEKPKTEKQKLEKPKKEEPKKEKPKLKKLEPKSKLEIEKEKKKVLEEKEREKALDEKLEEILKEE
jgi:small subunit ribosomal protein S6